MEYKYIGLTILNLILNILYIINIVSVTKDIIKPENIKNISSKINKYAIISTYISSIICYLIYISFIVISNNMDWVNDWIAVFAAYTLVNSCNVIYNKNTNKNRLWS